MPPRTLAFGPVAIALDSSDRAACDWLAEVLWPGFRPTAETADWRVRLSSSANAYAEIGRRRPPDA
ncbi:MAG: hypothetical protein ACREQQ_11800, partial [Candidatus Binatia bacterium]